MINLIRKTAIFFICLSSSLTCVSCNDDDNTNVPKVEDTFAKGADVSWITEMEASNVKFYNSAGAEMEGMKLMKSLGMNSVRLRVWVNPKDGWCNVDDLLVKAYRAKNLGLRIMVDFHYSDWWADPANQTKPAAWANLDVEGLKNAVADHTTEVLNVLKANNITPEWVQVGNETGNGMLWEEGRTAKDFKNYTIFNNAGYDAVKSVFPEAKVIVHLESGEDGGKFRWFFDGLKSNGGKWDVIGMSLYPIADWRETDEDWKTINTKCYANMQDMIARYGSDIMISEVGFPWDQPEAGFEGLSDIIAKTRSLPNGKGLGVFYWEPQAYGKWNGYTMGSFDDTGRPTKALDAFK